MARLKVNTIVDRNDSGQPSLPYGASIPSGELINVNGNVNLTGISTVGFVTSSDASVSGIVTATFFIGDGSGLQAIPTATISKAIALKLLMDPLPFRS